MSGNMKKTDEPIRVEITIHKDPETVWAAITEPDQMRKWFFDNIPDFKPVIGYEVEFDVESETRVFPHQWRVTEVIPRKLVRYNWKYGGYKGNSYVTFELRPENGSTRLTLTHTVTEDFQTDIPEFTRESCIGGWQYFVGERLKEYLS